MNGDFINATALGVWLHPRRSAYALIDLEVMQDTLESELTATRARLEESETARTETADAVTEALRTAAESRREAEDARQRIAELEEQLQEYGDIDARLEEFARQLEGIKQMKENYERTIADLRSQLRQQENLPTPHSPLPESDLIDFNDPTPDPITCQRHVPTADGKERALTKNNEQRATSNDDDWLDSLPDF